MYIPAAVCIVVFIHPEDSRATSNVSLPSGATLLLTGKTGLSGVYFTTKYYIIKVTDRAGSTLNFTHTMTGGNTHLWVRHAVINYNTSSVSTVTTYATNNVNGIVLSPSITSGKLYALIHLVDYRAFYKEIFPSPIIHYYEMPYVATTHVFTYYFSSIAVFKAQANMTFSIMKSGNYACALVNLN